jgi:hypothetical protein
MKFKVKRREWNLLVYCQSREQLVPQSGLHPVSLELLHHHHLLPLLLALYSWRYQWRRAPQWGTHVWAWDRPWHARTCNWMNWSKFSYYSLTAWDSASSTPSLQSLFICAGYATELATKLLIKCSTGLKKHGSLASWGTLDGYWIWSKMWSLEPFGELIFRQRHMDHWEMIAS